MYTVTITMYRKLSMVSKFLFLAYTAQTDIYKLICANSPGIFKFNNKVTEYFDFRLRVCLIKQAIWRCSSQPISWSSAEETKHNTAKTSIHKQCKDTTTLNKTHLIDFFPQQPR